MRPSSPIVSRRSSPRRDSAGFSLVEIVIAVGVAAFALMALLGLLPSGLKTFKSSVDASVGSQIAQRIFNDLQIADWASVTNNTNPVRFFDEQGTELADSNAINCIYWARVNVSSNSSGVSTTYLNNTTANLVTVNVMVANNPGGALPTNVIFSQTNQNTMTFTAFIGRNR
jgi:uncharacterized protein (TIGR02598 family)